MRVLKGLLPALHLLLAINPLSAAAKKNQPKLSEKTFNGGVGNVFYFDDSEVVILSEIETGDVYRSDDAGKSWDKQKHLRTLGVLKNPYDSNVAIAIGDGKKHWITYNKGEDWHKFETKEPASFVGSPISFHASDNKKIIFSTMEDCDRDLFGRVYSCLGKSYYTEDGFKSDPKLLHPERRMCVWAKSSDLLLKDDEKLDSRVLCIVKGKRSDLPKDNRLLISDNYFEDEEEPSMADGRTVSGMASMASVKSYLVVAAKSEHTNELALYVTKDTKTWHRAEFGPDHKIEEDAYTVLESTNYSIQVDVMTASFGVEGGLGTLMTSNSDGTYFTKNIEHTNRSPDGYVDFEKISNIQGIVMVNVVDNWEKVPAARRKLKSRISFDDGRTFEPLKADGKELHLHSVTNLHNTGRVFSSPAPGLVMGVGNTGDYLKDYTDGDLYVSDDAGLTWRLALQEAHKYEFGDQGSVLVAVFDEGETDEIKYSLKHGRPNTWESITLDYKFRALELTTVSDSTSLQFILVAKRRGKGGIAEEVVISVDFSGLHERKCEKDDFETWHARVDEDKKATCVMGRKQSFRRRKWDADCFVDEEFKDPVPEFEECDCDENRDYECDFGFTPEFKDDKKECKPSGTLTAPKDKCKGDDKTYEGSSGWRKIPGNQCKGKTDKDKTVERPCDETKVPPKSGKIATEITKFPGDFFRDYYYLERGDKSQAKDETVVMLTSERKAYISHDHGKEWNPLVADDEIVQIYPHQYNNDYVYLITPSKKVYYSKNRGIGTMHHFDAPSAPNMEHLQIMSFHPKNSEWLIWTGGADCKGGSKECHSVAYVSTKNGEQWDEVLPYVKKCSFIWREDGHQVNEKLMFCEQHENEQPTASLQLISSEDFFEHKDTTFKSVVEFATMSEFIIVATKAEDGKTLKVDASLDGKTFADAKFPPKFNVDHQTAYTVLDSSTHSIFLHVTVNPRREQEYGSILKSNSNGTSYVLSINEVNRNEEGYVDFEKMQGIEGVAIVNIVANKDEVDGGAKKKKKTKITHNDGADWALLKAPKEDSDHKKYKCNVDDVDKCSLHLHGYTERPDPRETFSSPTAVGIMMGVGNVGEYLDVIGEASTFITTDAGVTWKEAMKGNYIWEYGDQGSVIIIVRRGESTNHLYYTTNYGDKWERYDFSESPINVQSITTVPSDTSLNFLLWGKRKGELVTVNVDFGGLFEKKCDLNDEDPEAGDYELWTPEHPLTEEHQCLFGHVAQYHRKRKGRMCYNGQIIDPLHNIARNCSCTRRDFECDYNYERQIDGSCKKIAGLSTPDPKDVCKQKGVTEYWDITGYRKIPISTCEGGAEMEHMGQRHPCPGFEEEFKKKHGIGGFSLFLAIVLPFAAAAGIGYYVWRNWDGKFGRIRLGENGPSFDSDSAFVRWPVAAISGLVAVVAAIPLVVGSLWRWVSGRFGSGAGYRGRTFTSRSSFARGRGDYAVVDADEGELLGDDSDEDV
ncbi:vacuolar protein sorting/targeting protein 10 [Delitschia confertaspora ATCC 74209]|uniref:Vacuolar protein sorting/targeting protein 10 n=1 Tax=Delitschia confertaspora ATCC 74209 TaxID=1513339 RepID=A0A9P4JKZ5_9PLEO|nr:vacuolar protein sorting/targeting protein 10 [Delitschia confertaspora ATCC 74209]